MEISWLLNFVSTIIRSSTPFSVEEITLTPDMFQDQSLVYSAQHEIVSLTLPINSINIIDKNLEDDKPEITLFFVEAEVNNGEKDYKGLYRLKGDKATKILETGTDSATDNSNSDKVFMSATDGLYVYNYNEDKVERYGNITDNLINVVKLNSSDDLYVLTADHDVYRITEKGKNKIRLDFIKDAEQIVIDYSDNLYFYGADKQPYVVVGNGVRKIGGLPANPKSVSLIKPSFTVNGDEALFRSDDKIYEIYPNSTSEFGKYTLEVQPTAFALEGTMIHYYAYEKKIYKYNILEVAVAAQCRNIMKDLNSKKAEIISKMIQSAMAA